MIYFEKREGKVYTNTKIANIYSKLAFAPFSYKKVWHWVDGWVDGWMDEWMDGWMVAWVGAKAGLRIAYSNQKS